MTEPTTYPEDVMKAAREVGAARYVGPRWSHMRAYFRDGMHDSDPCVMAAAHAIMAERKRSANDLAFAAAIRKGE